MTYKDKAKQAEYQRTWMAARRALFFNGKKCVKCGSTESLQLDHVIPGEKVTHCVWSWTEVKRNAELQKCQALCAPCHLEKSTAERHRTSHGKARMYGHYKCRCELCRTWKRDSDARRRPRKDKNIPL